MNKLCPKATIECPNAGCRALVARDQMDEHLLGCEFAMVACPFAKYGCPFAGGMTRFELKVHHQKMGDKHAAMVAARDTLCFEAGVKARRETLNILGQLDASCSKKSTGEVRLLLETHFGCSLEANTALIDALVLECAEELAAARSKTPQLSGSRSDPSEILAALHYTSVGGDERDAYFEEEAAYWALRAEEWLAEQSCADKLDQLAMLEVMLSHDQWEQVDREEWEEWELADRNELWQLLARLQLPSC